MPLPDNFDKLLDNDLPLVTSHEFEIDLSCLVTMNYRITMEGIERTEIEELAQLGEQLKAETDDNLIHSIVSGIRNFYDDLRVAARNFAVVELVTRLQHWAEAYARRINPKRKTGQPIDKVLDYLNAELGKPPVATDFFFKLAEVRHSVIHADSQPRWLFKGHERVVDPRYVNGWRVEVDDEDVTAAIDKAIVQIKWYDEMLIALHK